MSTDVSLVSDFLTRCQTTRKRAAVCGDALVDVWACGQLTRISPESPSPVFKLDHTIERPGGAGNVAELMKPFNCSPTLHAALAETRCTKTRYCVGDQVLWRVDDDRKGRCALGYAAEIQREPPDVLIFSDYLKGALDESWRIKELIEFCKDRRIPVVVDTKRTPLSEWIGATVVKLNAAEWAAQPCDESALSIIVTNGPKRPYLIHTERQLSGAARTERFQTPIGTDLSVPVRSVSGAGDAFTAFVALALSHGFSLEQAGRIAHLAGTAYVQRTFNEAITARRLLAMVDKPGSKILRTDEAIVQTFNSELPSTPWVMANGVFDLIHAGHADTLQWAKQYAGSGTLIVAVNSDDSARRVKGPGRPVIDLENRMRSLAALDCVDFVVSFDEDTPERLLKVMNIDTLVKGSDCYFMAEDGQVPGQNLVAETVTAPVSPCLLHSSDIVRKIQSLPSAVPAEPVPD